MRKLLIIAVLVLFTFNNSKASDTLYVYKAGVVVMKQAVAQLDSLSFIPPSAPTTGTLTDIDGNTYHWITIGTQKWMVENLRTTKFRTGESISNITNDGSWGAATFAAWCDYDYSKVNGVKYGHLYNWYAASDNRNIAPVGWHVPSDSEWTILENYLIANGYNYDGTTSGNKIGKSIASKTDWNISSNSGSIGNDLSKNNISGFCALPGGYHLSYSSFYFLGNECHFWTITESNSLNSWGRSLNYGSSQMSRSTYMKSDGFSIRCIKD